MAFEYPIGADEVPGRYDMGFQACCIIHILHLSLRLSMHFQVALGQFESNTAWPLGPPLKAGFRRACIEGLPSANTFHHALIYLIMLKIP